MRLKHLCPQMVSSSGVHDAGLEELTLGGLVDLIFDKCRNTEHSSLPVESIERHQQLGTMLVDEALDSFDVGTKSKVPVG